MHHGIQAKRAIKVANKQLLDDSGQAVAAVVDGKCLLVGGSHAITGLPARSAMIDQETGHVCLIAGLDSELPMTGHTVTPLPDSRLALVIGGSNHTARISLIDTRSSQASPLEIQAGCHLPHLQGHSATVLQEAQPGQVRILLMGGAAVSNGAANCAAFLLTLQAGAKGLRLQCQALHQVIVCASKECQVAWPHLQTKMLKMTGLVLEFALSKAY